MNDWFCSGQFTNGVATAFAALHGKPAICSGDIVRLAVTDQPQTDADWVWLDTKSEGSSSTVGTNKPALAVSGSNLFVALCAGDTVLVFRAITEGLEDW